MRTLLWGSLALCTACYQPEPAEVDGGVDATRTIFYAVQNHPDTTYVEDAAPVFVLLDEFAGIRW